MAPAGFMMDSNEFLFEKCGESNAKMNPYCRALVPHPQPTYSKKVPHLIRELYIILPIQIATYWLVNIPCSNTSGHWFHGPSLPRNQFRLSSTLFGMYPAEP